MNKKNKERRFVLRNKYFLNYMAEMSMLVGTSKGIDYYRVVDGLDVDLEPYYTEISTVMKEMHKAIEDGIFLPNLEDENTNERGIEVCISCTNKLSEICIRMEKDYNPVKIVELYLKRITEDISYDEIEELTEKLTEYVENLRLFHEEKYQQVYEKYGPIETQTLIKYLEIANRISSK